MKRNTRKIYRCKKENCYDFSKLFTPQFLGILEIYLSERSVDFLKEVNQVNLPMLCGSVVQSHLIHLISPLYFESLLRGQIIATVANTSQITGPRES